MSERRVVMTVAAAAVITIFAHNASAQSDRDRRDAQRALYRCDANRDGSIDRDEAGRSHWSTDPFQFDANGDGRLTASELAVRYARRRLDRQDLTSGSNAQTPSSTSRYDSSRRRAGDRSTGSDSLRSDAKTDSEPPNVYAYRTRSAYERLFGDLPTWFKEKDADLDGQVMMSEYASEWTDELAEEFAQLDLNGDGVITSKECPNSPGEGSIVGISLARSVPSPAPPASPAPSSDTDESSDTDIQLAENGTLPPAEAKAVARDARRQLWGKLYSSKRPGQP